MSALTCTITGIGYPRVGGWGSVEEAAHVVRKVVPSAHLIEAEAEEGVPIVWAG